MTKGEEYRAYLRERAAEFRDEYAASLRDLGMRRGAFVPARKIAVTGLVLYELEQAGFIEREGSTYRPRRQNSV